MKSPTLELELFLNNETKKGERAFEEDAGRRESMMDEYVNLWDETVNKLKEHGKEPKDIQFVCGNDFGLVNFEDLAKRTDYDSGYGGQLIAEDLKVVGTDWWLERHEYDGAEWWEYKELPKKPEVFEVMETLEGIWDTLKEIKEGDN